MLSPILQMGKWRLREASHSSCPCLPHLMLWTVQPLAAAPLPTTDALAAATLLFPVLPMGACPTPTPSGNDKCLLHSAGWKET